MDVIGIYRRHASLFDRERSRSLLERPWLERFRALLPPGGAVLDLGCGMGEPVAAFLLAQGHPVTGLDASPPLLELARERLPAGEWIEGDMREAALGRRFAGVLAWDSFFHLPQADQRRMFAVFAAHALPGAPLMFTAGPADGEAWGEFGGEALHHASLAPAEYRLLLASHGFAVAAHRAEDPECGGRTVWLCQAASTG